MLWVSIQIVLSIVLWGCEVQSPSTKKVPANSQPSSNEPTEKMDSENKISDNDDSEDVSPTKDKDEAKEEDSSTKADQNETVDQPSTPQDDNSIDNEDRSNSSGEINKPRETCVLEKDELPTVLTITSVTQIINKLPKPVSVPCLIDVLPRPFKVHATDSELSIQPASGKDNPRFFLNFNKLILSFSLSLEGMKSIEFSELLGDSLSVKGEIAFPVTKTLEEDAAFQQVLQKKDPNQTRCNGCHGLEEPAGEPYPPGAFKSRALRPFERQNVSNAKLESLSEACFQTGSLRCQILNSLTQKPSIQDYRFPESMPTLF